MDKNAIKKYAVWARRELIIRVTQKAEQYEITEKKITPADADSIGGRVLTVVEKKQRQLLIDKINQDGFEQVMEEVAYAWFNRFTALRFMEVNNYLPSRTRVFTNENGEFKPQILADAIELDLDGLDMDQVYELKNANKTEELYKYLLITQCNALSAILPRMFQKIEHYTELLLPDYLLREGSVIEQMIALIPEEDWTDQVQIIGWLYQYYNTEPKDTVFAALKKNIKISKENIPAATQLFTPDWIVRYMVENSLGRLWLEGHPDSKEHFLPTKEEQSVYAKGGRDSKDTKWHYYLEEAEQEPNVQKQLDMIRKEYAALKPEEIRCIDPCMGSGHILCYMFDVLVKIYEDYGYTVHEAVGNIVEKNLWGLDIDERASQLSYFAVMMKACQYDHRFLSRGLQPNVYAIEESNGITSALMHGMGIDLSKEEYGRAVKEAMRLVEEMHDAKEYGSIVHVTPCDWGMLRRFAVPRGSKEGQMMLDIHGEVEASRRLQNLINIGEAFSQKYHAVVTNPPYMGASGMSPKLYAYVKANYADSKSDMFAVFIERCAQLIEKYGFYAMITQHAWMFLSSFESLRNKMFLTETINMAHLGAKAFEEIGGEVVQTTAFVRSNIRIKGYKGLYVRLVDPNTQQGKEKVFLEGDSIYYVNQSIFEKIPFSTCAYWISPQLLSAFETAPKVADLGEPKVGLQSGNSEKYFRLWYEVEFDRISFNKDLARKWFPCVKGGEARKWFGNNLSVIDWSNDGYGIKHEKSAVVRNPAYYFREGLTWTKITSIFALRYFPPNMMLSDSSVYVFPHDYKSMLGCLNSKVAPKIIELLNPTLNFVASTVAAIPILVSEKEKVCELVDDNITLAKQEWDDYEISWDFQRHPLVPLGFQQNEKSLSDLFDDWKKKCDIRFKRLKENEEELNRIFINTYGLQEELNEQTQDKDITVRRADLQRDVRNLISYAVGCMFGRYSLDVLGLIYARGTWDASKYKSFHPDKDAIIPICDDEYFDDDIVGRFIKFVELVYGRNKLEENLRFIANAIGGKGSSREVIRNYFMNDFYADHLKVYQKRPIYWLFDSGKKNGFKCLIYMHRYQPDTIARIRTDYVHEQQSRYRTAIADLEQRINGASTSERVKLNKQLTKLQAQAAELREYEEKIHHLADQMISIDLDDGVKVNYAKFQDVLAKIK